MTFARRFIALLGISILTPALAGSPLVYKCKDDSGTTVYQAYPCADAESEKVRVDPEPSGLGTVYHRADPPAPEEDENDLDDAKSALGETASDSDKRTRTRLDCVEETGRYNGNLRLQNYALKLCKGGLSAAAMHGCMEEGRKQRFTLDGWPLHVENCVMRGGPSG